MKFPPEPVSNPSQEWCDKYAEWHKDQTNPPKSSPDELPCETCGRIDCRNFLWNTRGKYMKENDQDRACTLTAAQPQPFQCPAGLTCSGDGWDCIEAGRLCEPQLTQENTNVSEDEVALHKPQREAGDLDVCPSCGSLPCDQAQKPDDRLMVMWRALQALKECQSIIADMSDPNKVDERTSVNVLWARCVAADRKALSAISELTYYAGGKNA